jgi:hypothetical protein
MTPTRPRTTEELITHLAGSAVQVRPLAPSGRRAAAWLGSCGIAALAMVLAVTGTGAFLAAVASPLALAEWLAMLATGIVGVIAAFQLSVPGHAAVWRHAVWWPAALWCLLASGGCFSAAGGLQWTDGSTLWHYLECFGFIIGCGLPLSFALFAGLRRAAPLWPLGTAVSGCLGVAGLAAAFMRFFHPADPTVIDLASHCVALGIVSGLGAVRARAALLP